jgi:hypothetical protein
MKRELFFEDGSAMEVNLEVSIRGTMATAALQRLIDFLDYELPDEPDIALQAEGDILDIEEEVLADEELEDIDDLEEEWEEDWEEEDWEEEEEEDGLDEDWDEDEDLFR